MIDVQNIKTALIVLIIIQGLRFIFSIIDALYWVSQNEKDKKEDYE